LLTLMKASMRFIVNNRATLSDAEHRTH